jgi:hypothetical protein
MMETLYWQASLVKVMAHMTQSKCIQFKTKRVWDDFQSYFNKDNNLTISIWSFCCSCLTLVGLHSSLAVREYYNGICAENQHKGASIALTSRERPYMYCLLFG